MKLKFSNSEIARKIARCFADSSAIDPVYGKLFCVDSSFVTASGRHETFTINLDDTRLEFCPFIAIRESVKVQFTYQDEIPKFGSDHKETGEVEIFDVTIQDCEIFGVDWEDGFFEVGYSYQTGGDDYDIAIFEKSKEEISLDIKWALAQEGVEEVV